MNKHRGGGAGWEVTAGSSSMTEVQRSVPGLSLQSWPRSGVGVLRGRPPSAGEKWHLWQEGTVALPHGTT